MNIVYEDNKAKLVSHSERSPYDLTDIKIYISDNYRKYDIFLCVRNLKNDIFDTLKLYRTDYYSDSLDIYSVELKQTYGKLYDGDVIAKLLFVNPVREKMFFSEEFKILDVSFGNFKMGSNLFSSSDIEEQLNEMNKRIEKIEEIIKKGDGTNAINN